MAGRENRDPGTDRGVPATGGVKQETASRTTGRTLCQNDQIGINLAVSSHRINNTGFSRKGEEEEKMGSEASVRVSRGS